jgi:succinate-acetate transporter protein
MVTPGGHPVDFSQPAIPVQHRKFGNPLPVGLFSFSMGFWVAGLYTLQARGVTKPNLVLPMFSE